MMQKWVSAEGQGRAFLAATGLCALCMAIWACLRLPDISGAATMALAASGGLVLWDRATRGSWPRPQSALTPLIVMAALAMARSDAVTVWQVPARWADILEITPLGAAICAGIYIAADMGSLAHRDRHLRAREAGAVLALPLLFDLGLSIGATGLMETLGRALLGEGRGLALAAACGRSLVLLLFGEAVAVLLGLVVRGRPLVSPRFHMILVIAAMTAAATPWLATAPQLFSAAPVLIAIAAATAAAAVAQAGLWSFVYLFTGLAMDALRGKPPSFAAAWDHWRTGLVKGAIYGGLFIGLLLITGTILRDPDIAAALRMHWLFAGALGGALLFPLAQTIISSADETPPFHLRLMAAYRNPWNALRGVVVGLGGALALTIGLEQAGGGQRFLWLFLLGASAYAGVDLLRDAAAVLRGPRRHVQSWRIYALGALLGGIVAGALGWYFDAAQIAVVTAKFWAYVDLDYAKEHRAVTPYVIYALFSKWGMMDLGTVAGGVKLFYLESLSGVINWSLAAPLFSINFFLLSALVQRSLAPVRELFSSRGLEGLVEQAVRVLRWGLWMAPVIYSFLRMSPEPSWYNQDGAIRSIAASIADVTLPGSEFGLWSLAVFTGLLAYDWLRILIWFDHMGLRVASLVNLSFVGGDRGDEAAARFAGHAMRTTFVPDGIRRFGTWAPLLIPFYIPRGADWDRAWSGAEQIHAQHLPMSTPVASIVTAYATGFVVALVVSAAVWQRMRLALPSGTPPEGIPDCLVSGRRRFRLSNGTIGMEMMPDGRGFTHLHGAARRAGPIDLTRRPTDRLEQRGTFFYLEEPGRDDRWSVGFEPVRRLGDDYRIEQTRPDTIVLTHLREGVAAELTIALSDTEPVELRRLRLVETQGRARRLVVTSFQELAGNEPGAYLRDPDFNAMHVETIFSRQAQAIFFRNRLLRDRARSEKARRMSPEIMFHAVALGAAARLAGYEDSRTRFIGTGSFGAPQGLSPGRHRDLDDEGLLATFDPAASLRISVELGAHSVCDLVFLNGHAPDMETAARLAAHYVGRGLPPGGLTALSQLRRDLEPGRRAAGDWPFSFDAAGKVLHLTGSTPRPWAHVMANAGGFGTMVSNDGEIYTFAGNARHNGLTPWTSDPVAAGVPGQRLFVLDLDSAETFAAMQPPPERKDLAVSYGLGVARFRREAGGLGLEVDVATVPDAPADLRILTIRNLGAAARHLRVVAYLDMVLGEEPAESQGHLRSWTQDGNVLLFENPRNDFRKGVAFAATSLDCDGVETVRARFLGSPCRSLADPVMVVTGLTDPSQADDGRRCAAFSQDIEIAPRESATMTLVLGQCDSPDHAVALARRLRRPEVARSTMEATERWWHQHLSGVEVTTNDPAFDRLVNHWLPYQLFASRLWGRLGPNQRGGAIGYRDQLQDVLPLLFHQPDLVRRQILLHAGQQFVEGDVLKWWHPAPDGRTGMGQRTRASDPHLWLPYVLTRYVEATGDATILDLEAAYLDAPPLARGRSADLVVPRESRESDHVYGHCMRAIDLALASLGPHGLPRVGSGDWNDGIDTAGLEGRGESLWLGFFLHDVLTGFARIADRRDPQYAARCRRGAETLSHALEHGWQGGRYIIGFDDEGVAFSQASIMTAAWPILSGAVDFERGRAALEAGLETLERRDRILLLAPPFDETSRPYPGRIADYPAGVRENAAQYTHGATWVVDAFMRLAAMARGAGSRDLADRLNARATECWYKLSPLGKTEGAALAAYGLAPHQQPADIYDGAWQDGRGGWSWYTGSAARMLSAAYAIIGMEMRNGTVHLPQDLARPRGDLRIERLRVGREFVEAPSRAEVT